MAAFVFNISKGRVAELHHRVDQNDPAGAVLIVVPIETSGLESDATLKDKDDLAAVLSGATNEQTTMGRKTLSDSDVSAISIDDTNDWSTVDIPDQTFVGATGNPVSKLLLCYYSGTGGDAATIPCACYDYAITPDGSDAVAQVDPAGYFKAS